MRFNPRQRVTAEKVIHKLAMASMHYESETDKHWMTSAADDIAWYILSERASMDWYRAFIKADTVKLLRRMARADDKSRNGQIRIATAYLRRYCGYERKEN